MKTHALLLSPFQTRHTHTMSPVHSRVRRKHYRREGRGGGGDGGGSHGDDGGDGQDGKDGSKGTNKETDVPVSGATDGAHDAVAYGPGGSKAKVIPEGDPFAGRESGGGVRGEVYGTW